MESRKRKLAIIAQDPSVRLRNGAILMATVGLPHEYLAPGPWGHRVKVVDYDASTGHFYQAAELHVRQDPYQKRLADPNNVELVGDRTFHTQNVYAITMRVLALFEKALGRRVAWSFPGHQLHIAPHAFRDANAFYVEENQVLCFGYFHDPEKGRVFTCLSHDIVAHETAHALLDALKTRYTDPSSPDQAAFHEGFADIVALLSVFSLGEVVMELLPGEKAPQEAGIGDVISADVLKPYDPTDPMLPRLENTVLLGLAEELGGALSKGRRSALRQSVTKDFAGWLADPAYDQPHRRGEVLVAVFMRAFLSIWRRRMDALGATGANHVSLRLLAEEGAKVAEHLLLIGIRALDYAPPTDIQFSDYLSALLTADARLVPDDSTYRYRDTLREEFGRVGIEPASAGDPMGIWKDFERPDTLDYRAVHAEQLRSDVDELYRFIWDNRRALEIDERAFTRVLSVRPAVRTAPDGFVVRETVADYIQILELTAGELRSFGICKPPRLPPSTPLRLYGGGVLIFDEHGVLQYHVNNRVLNGAKQTKRLRHLAEAGYFLRGDDKTAVFAQLHRLRAGLGTSVEHIEEDIEVEVDQEAEATVE